MNAYFGIGKAKQGSEYIPKLGEVVLYERDKELDMWDTRIGDGKTSVKDLPPLSTYYDIYERVRILEEKVSKLEIKT
ncbi:MAG: hypothetical protein EBU90_04035 [Proteobacteria bacterium]|nr:hypothetical protein [Pseudomonadota bacterium]NBP16210.1 hypothetical protein [bacterium]